VRARDVVRIHCFSGRRPAIAAAPAIVVEVGECGRRRRTLTRFRGHADIPQSSPAILVKLFKD